VSDDANQITQADIEAVRSYADKLSAEARLYATQESNRARTQATIAFGLLATVLALLSALGLNGFVRDIARPVAIEEAKDVIRKELPGDLAAKIRALYETSLANTEFTSKQRDTARQLVEAIRSSNPVLEAVDGSSITICVGDVAFFVARQLTSVPVSSPHTRVFAFTFPTQLFAEAPRVVHSVEVVGPNANGFNYVLYNSKLTGVEFSGSLVETLARKANVPVYITSIAIGKGTKK